MPLAPALTPLQAMRQQLVSRSLAGLGAADAAEAAAANERQPGTGAGAKTAPQPPLAPRRVSLSVSSCCAAQMQLKWSSTAFASVCGRCIVAQRHAAVPMTRFLLCSGVKLLFGRVCAVDPLPIFKLGC